jgi:Leucine-rich repeat (LRR) protein
MFSISSACYQLQANPGVSKIEHTNCGLTNLDVETFGGHGSFLTDLQEIDLSFNQLNTIANRTFCRARNLLNLDLSNNLITNIETDAFTELGRLENLSISQNKLTAVDWTWFEKTTMLRTLHISNNYIARIDDKNTRYLSIEKLDISNNHLSDINKVRNLPNLTTLDMGNNLRMTYNAKTFENNTELYLLYLDNTNLEHITNFDFLKNTPKLGHLFLINNNLENIKIQKLPSLAQLFHLNLWNTNLTTLDYQYLNIKFPNLKEINISENKFGCMFLKEFLNYLIVHEIGLLHFFSNINLGFHRGGVHCINHDDNGIDYPLI